MSEQKVINRWLVVAGGILIQLCLGAIYAWKAFTGKLTAEPYGFTKLQSQMPFFLGLLTFAVVMAFVAGRWQKKVGPRVVALTGGIVLGLGYIIAGLSGTSFWGILIGVGLLGGAGIGLGYVCPIAALAKWFPDKKGLIMGLAVAGFGFGALIWVKLTQGFAFGPIDLTPGWSGLYGAEWTANNVFLLYGVLFAALVGLGSLFMVNPPDGWKPSGWTPPPAKDGVATGSVDLTELQMAKTPQFWTLFLTFTAGATAGLMVIGVIGLFGKDKLTASGITLENADIMAGTAMGLFFGASTSELPLSGLTSAETSLSSPPPRLTTSETKMSAPITRGSSWHTGSAEPSGRSWVVAWAMHRHGYGHSFPPVLPASP